MAYQLLAQRYDPAHFCFNFTENSPSTCLPKETTSFGVSSEDLEAYQARQEEMGVLREWAKSACGATPRRRRMLLHGLGGAGKTTLALVFSAQVQEEGPYEAVLFLTLSDGNCLSCYSELTEMLERNGTGAVEAQVPPGSASVASRLIWLLSCMLLFHPYYF